MTIRTCENHLIIGTCVSLCVLYECVPILICGSDRSQMEHVTHFIVNSARRTIAEMLTDRGVKGAMDDDIEYSGELESLSHTIDGVTVIWFNEGQPVGLPEIRSLRAPHTIVICTKPLTPLANNYISTIQTQRIEVFSIWELVRNKTKHRLVPRHEIMTSDEVRKLRKQLAISLSSFPKISRSDPIARYYGATRGQVIRVTRRDNTLQYRVVV